MKISMDVVRSWFHYIGATGLDGSNLANEPSHNAHSKNAKEFGMVIENDFIGHGNDGVPISWEDFVDFIIHSRKPIGTRNNDTGHWCIGGSKIFPYRNGLPMYIVTNREDGYFKYSWNWEGDIDSWPKVSTSDVNKITGLTISEDKIEYEEYKKLAYCDRFTNEPNFFFGIRKWTDSRISIRPKNIIKNLNLTFCSVPNFKYWVNNLEGSQIYFPTIVNDEIPKGYFELELVESKSKQENGIFDIYHYKCISDKYSVTDSLRLDSKAGGNIFKKVGSKDSSPHNHFFNQEGVYLLSQNLGRKEMNATEYNYSNMVFVQVGGDFTFPTVKTEKLDGKLHELTWTYHKEYIDGNVKKQHGGNKGEDSKVLECVNHIQNDTQYKAGLCQSIQSLCDDELNRKEILNPINNITFSTPNPSEREHDWIIKKDNEKIATIHFEFENGKADWDHITKFYYTMNDDNIPYQVFVVDSLTNSSKKINSLKTNIESAISDWVKRVYVIELGNLLKGNDKFELIYEKEKK